jgi:hypothetical protein
VKVSRSIHVNGRRFLAYKSLDTVRLHRACIGERFALTEVKVAMVKLLQHFHIEADETTRYLLQIS